MHGALGLFYNDCANNWSFTCNWCAGRIYGRFYIVVPICGVSDYNRGNWLVYPIMCEGLVAKSMTKDHAQTKASRRGKIVKVRDAGVVSAVLGLDEADAKGLILGRQTWKMYKENNLKGPSQLFRP